MLAGDGPEQLNPSHRIVTHCSRLILTAASLLLILAYVLPIWRISLQAPQYPEGLGMHIWVNNITGQKKHDLDKINNLNHYIGMKSIHPESIKELQVMPYIIGALLLLGVVAAAFGKRWMLYVWTALFLLTAIVGLVDFYLWEYDYGHNLDPRAAISIPGMSYQPPLIGSKKLLNFTAVSIPAAAGWAIFASLFAGIFLTFSEWRRGRVRRISPTEA